MADDGAGGEDGGYGAYGLPAQWMPTASADMQLLPYWNGAEEQPEHCNAILEFHVRQCPDFQKGYCAKHGGKGKASQCFDYHFESQRRRCPIDAASGQLLYWDMPCQGWTGEMSFCPNGDACVFAHGFEEVSYHPAKYKTRPCNGRDCRGEGACCFAHGDPELRRWAPDCYSYVAIMGPLLGLSAPAASSSSSPPAAGRRHGGQSQGAGSGQLKHRFCASYPNVNQCRRGSACAFAHSREEVKTPLLVVEEEEHNPAWLTEPFFTGKFKTLWCPIGAQHDWQSCVYAHTYQDARRQPSIGYGPQPCPYWSKKDTRAAYSQRCPLGLRCPYSHGAKEQLYHPKYFRTVICRDLSQRGCPRQHLCAFHHKRSERRSVGQDTVDYSKPLAKQAIPPDWAAGFLSPPFFQETGDNSEQVHPSMPSMAPGAWGMGMGFPAPCRPLAVSRPPPKAHRYGPSSAATAAAAAAAAVAESTSGGGGGASREEALAALPEESPRTQSTAADEGESAYGGACRWGAVHGGFVPYFAAPCYGEEGLPFGEFPYFAGGMMQPVWWAPQTAEDAPAEATAA